MRNALNLIEKNRSIKKKMIFAFLFLSILVVTLTISFLIRPAYSAVNKADCGVVEHAHTAQCYSEHKNYGESVLVCCSDLLQEMLSHIHDDFCYDENGKIICPLSEYQHVHTDDCYDENGVQICGTAYHQHGKECFRVLDENESALVLKCGKEAHVHVDSCYPELSSAPLDKMQVDFEKTQIIEPDFEEAEIIESEMELYESVIDNGISLLNDENSNVASSDGYVLTTSNIESVTLQYKDAKGKWITVTNGMTNVPANADIRIDVNYKNVNKSDIVNNTIIYNGIPAWLNPDSTGNIYNEDGNVVASLSVVNGNAIITFDQSYLDSLSHATIDGAFSVEGSADWREINTPSQPAKPLGVTLDFTFEDNLAAKYGNFKVDKKHAEKPVEVWENGKLTHTYLKYELKVKSEESEIVIPNICITDVLSTENWLNLSDVIVGNGYKGVTGTEPKTTLESSANGYNPYETVTGVQSYNHGTVILNDKNNLKWEIESLQPNEERTLVYYVELNEKYVGSGSAGILRNEAKPESKGFKKESVRDEFIPKADVDISKTQVSKNIDDFGNGTIDYTITVTANQNNSYTITDAYIKDAFGSGMGKYVVGGQQLSVTITKGDVTSNYEATVGGEGFNVPIAELKPGETVTITYSLQVQQLYSHENGNYTFTNHASFVGGNNNEKLKKNHTFKGSGATTWVTHNQWMRKMNGQTVSTATDISFGSNDAVYNYGNNTAQSGINGFTVPQNAQEYTVIVNEDGTWNMSGTNFVDKFQDTRIAYTGYLRIDEFTQTDKIPKNNGLNNETVLSTLNNETPTKTVWVNIDGKSSFDIIPNNYGLTGANKVYRLIYYAAVKSTETNIKNIVVANEFTLTGDIGIGEDYITLGDFKTIVSSTLTGSASYDFDKESLFFEKKHYTSEHGEIYWVIRANGTLPKDLHIQDQPGSKNSIRSDSLVGVYFGDKGYDFSGIESYDELDTALSADMEKLDVGTSKYFYNLQTISSLADLDGNDFAIFSHGNNSSGYLTGNQNGINTIKGESLSTRVNFGTDVETNEIVQTWHFDRVGSTDKFYIYYEDSSGRHYMHISAAGSATINTEQESPLTIDFKNNQIKIANSDITETDGCNSGEALNWYGDNGQQIYYSGWKNIDNGNNWHYLGTLDNSPRYSYTPQTITDVNALDGNTFAIITPGTHNSGLLVGGVSDKKANALTGEWYTTKFSDNPPTITRKSALQKWKFEKKIGGASDEFYVYYTENEQQYFLELGNDSATTTVTPTTVKISCKDGKIRLKAPDGIMALDWNGGGQDAQTVKPYYSTWKNVEDSDNRLHYVVTEDEISAGSSNYAYNWSANSSNGNIKIDNDTVIPQDKSVYIVLRTHPDEALVGNHSKIFDNEVGIVDNTTGDFYKLDGDSYIYKPNLPLYKEGKVAVYYNAEEQDTTKQWKICSVYPGDARKDSNTVWTNSADPVFSNEREVIKANGSGLYVEWLMNVNWDGTIDGDVILTDHLDHKMEPVLVRQFNLGSTSTQYPPEYKTIPDLENDPDWAKSQTHEVPFYYNKKTGELKVAVGNLHKAASENSAVVNLQLICRVTDPNVIFSGDVSTLTNKADLATTNGTIIGRQEINHDILPTYSIEKTVTPPKDANNQYVGNSNKMTYTIEINPYAEDLIDGNTLPVLIDKMTGKMELIGDIEVYKKVGDDETILDNIDISIAKNGNVTPNTTTIEFKNLPDEMYLIIKYKTKVDVKPNQTGTDISNIAYWEGYGKPSTAQQSGEFKYTLSGYVSSKSYADVVIKKCDFYDSSITLDGAEFEIRQVDINGNVDTNDSNTITATTDKNGKIHFNAESTSKLSFNTVYQIKETKAPTDYVLDDKLTYFMIVNGSHNYTIDNEQITVGNQKVDVIIDYASDDNTIPDLELTIYNKKGSVKVVKEFYNESNETVNPGNGKFLGTYRFGLYYKVPTPNNAIPEQILSITYSGTGEPLYALDGKATNEPEFTKAKVGTENRAAVNYIYELNEKNEPITGNTDAYLNGYSFTVMYGNGNSVVVTKNGALNSITIKNKYNPIYMPSAGGIGLKNYYKISFFALMILSTLTAAVFRVRRKHK